MVGAGGRGTEVGEESRRFAPLPVQSPLQCDPYFRPQTMASWWRFGRRFSPAGRASAPPLPLCVQDGGRRSCAVTPSLLAVGGKWRERVATSPAGSRGERRAGTPNGDGGGRHADASGVARPCPGHYGSPPLSAEWPTQVRWIYDRFRRHTSTLCHLMARSESVPDIVNAKSGLCRRAAKSNHMHENVHVLLVVSRALLYRFFCGNWSFFSVASSRPP